MHALRIAILLLLAPATAVAGTAYEVISAGATQLGSKNNAGVYIGQSFNSGTNTLLTSAAIGINRNGLSTADFTLNLQLATGSPGAYFASGTPLQSLTVSNAVLSDTTNTTYTFNDLNWAVDPQTVYMIGIASESSDTVKWTLNQSATRDNSTGFITGFSGYNAQEGTNVDNGLHIATINAVPEPSTWAIAVTGMLALAIRLRGSSARRRAA